MNETKAAVRQQLIDDGYSIGELQAPDCSVVIFENASVLGFVFFYTDSAALLANWKNDSERILRESQFSLRRAGEKSWNTYTVFLADTQTSPDDARMLHSLEENLAGTRKIARTGVKNIEDLRLALLPLLAIQNAPRLEPIDMRKEIRLRTPELSDNLVDGFIRGAPDSIMTQLLEAEK